jgi:hypothetical protein
MWLSVRVPIEDELVRLRRQLALERGARRHRAALQELASATGRVVTRRGVARAIADRASDLLSAGWASVGFVGDDDIAHFVHGPTVPDIASVEWSESPLDVEVPINAVLRGDLRRVELTDREAIMDWPLLVPEIDRLEMSSLVIEPIPPSPGRPAAALALAWPEPHALTELERELLDELIDAASPAFERARRTEIDREVADTLQNWLLPPSVPELAHLQISTLYRPGTGELAVGGDWYDVVKLDDDTSAIVVGDVVGHDVRAAAEMGQVRHVLASQLLATSDVASALTLTDRYFFGREIDTMATALVMIFDARSACLHLSSAGHLAPIVCQADTRSRLIECGLGPPIGSGLGGYVAVRQDLPPSSLLVAFTDGVIEQRDRPIDDSLEALCRDIDECLGGLGEWWASSRSGRRVMQVLRQRADEPWRRDDVAAVVVRHAPPLPAADGGLGPAGEGKSRSREERT